MWATQPMTCLVVCLVVDEAARFVVFVSRRSDVFGYGLLNEAGRFVYDKTTRRAAPNTILRN